MGDTFAPQEGACLGRSVTSWTSGSGLSPFCSRARRWRPSAPSSGSRGRRATRCSIGTRTAECRLHGPEPAALPAVLATVEHGCLTLIFLPIRRKLPSWGPVFSICRVKERATRQSKRLFHGPDIWEHLQQLGPTAPADR